MEVTLSMKILPWLAGWWALAAPTRFRFSIESFPRYSPPETGVDMFIRWL